METVEVTWSRTLRFWWAALWRSIVFANLFAGAVAGILAAALAILGDNELGGTAGRWFIDVVTIAWIPAFVFATRTALQLTYKDFRVALIDPAAPPCGPATTTT
jgi:hypothetical protein